MEVGREPPTDDCPGLSKTVASTRRRLDQKEA
jgi:hypothetical protein